jgi:2-keto-4-pentenoate hydratase/2-oxohepta-3-ene-1,7-dioic acid hydratase in catechol pathway
VKIVVFGPERRVGALHGDVVVDLNRADQRVPADLAALIASGAAGIEAAQRALERALHDGSEPLVQPASGVALHAPWARKRIACAGGNFAAHSYGMAVSLGTPGVTMESETKRIRDRGQWGFWKILDEVAGPEDEIPFPSRSAYFDYEGEAVIVIGRRARDVKADRLGDVIWGVTLGNDWSIRDDKFEQWPVQYNLMKNFDRSASLGPCIVVGELDPQNVQVETHVDGDRRQSYNTKDMVFSFGEILEHLSRDFTFVPGDLIFGGTAEGTAMDTTRPNPDGSRPKDNFLRIGQSVEVSSPQIGVLKNAIVPQSPL